MNICPSAPMFQKLALKETVRPTAASPIGTERRNAAVRSSRVVKTVAIWWRTLIASMPSACIRNAAKRSARARKTTVIASETEAGTSSLRSILRGMRIATSM